MRKEFNCIKLFDAVISIFSALAHCCVVRNLFFLQFMYAKVPCFILMNHHNSREKQATRFIISVRWEKVRFGPVDKWFAPNAS